MQTAALLHLIENTLEFTYHQGDVTEMIRPHTTGWRTLPYLVTAQADGRGTLEVHGKGRMFGDDRGSAICVAPGVHHCCTLLAERGISHWSCTNFKVLGGIDVFNMIEAPFFLRGNQAQTVREVNTELAALSRIAEPSLQDIARKKVLGYTLFAAIAAVAQWRSDQDQALMESQRLIPVFAHVQENIHRPLRLSELARRAHLSPSRFHAVFKQSTGTSPHQYVQRRRLQRAQELLISTDLSINEIAEKVGQPDPGFFSRQFKQLCGDTPTGYRARIRKGIA
jgi:AraC family transcriptional regulator, arabinose operon regulatory protein